MFIADNLASAAALAKQLKVSAFRTTVQYKRRDPLFEIYHQIFLCFPLVFCLALTALRVLERGAARRLDCTLYLPRDWEKRTSDERKAAQTAVKRSVTQFTR